MDVDKPTINNVLTGIALAAKSSGYTDGKKVSVASGTLWASWKNDGSEFRAIYSNNKNKHRCTAQDDSNDPNSLTGKCLRRSSWENAGTKAYSPWIWQTLFGNRVFASVK
ncbi:hypothetical protein [Intestinibacter sp.]